MFLSVTVYFGKTKQSFWQAAVPAPSSFDSLEKLKEQEKIEHQVPSEVSGIQIMLTDKGHVYLISDREKVLPVSSQLGGFGAGQYSKAAECGAGISFKLPDKDRTTVQVDESTMRENAATGAVATLSLYKLLIRTEREKGVTAHKLSYHSVSRLADVQPGSDGFSIEPKEDMKFKLVQTGANGEPSKIVCKNIFSKCPIDLLEQSQHVTVAFRFRFERVGLSLKVQKPYLITKAPLTFRKGEPLRVV